MKRLLMIASVATMALGIASCENDPNALPKGMTRLTVKMTGVKTPDIASRAVQDGAQQIDLTVDTSSSVIYVTDAAGSNIVQVVDVTAAATNGSGQELLTPVAVGAKVYVVANIPTPQEVTTFKALTTLEAVKTATSAISNVPNDFRIPPMANIAGDADKTVQGGAATEEIAITIEPLVARLELISMQAIADGAGNVITDFDVTGIWVGNYYPSFTYTGTASGTAASLEADIEADDADTALGAWASYMKDTGSWSAAGGDTDPLIAKLANDGNGDPQVWGYNLVPNTNAMPTMIIRLENIVAENSSGTALTVSGARYLTVAALTTNGTTEITSIVRGDVYTMGKITDDESSFKFSFANLGLTPYEEAVKLTVDVTVEQWSINDYTPKFQ